MGWGGFWLEDDGTEKEFGGWEGREVADKCWGRGEEWGQDLSAAWLALEGGWLRGPGRLTKALLQGDNGQGGHGSRAQLRAGSASHHPPRGTLPHSLG